MKIPQLATPFLFIFLALSSALPAGEEKMTWRLVLSQTSGGCSLTLFADGSGKLSYGAAPYMVRVATRTFDYEQINRSARLRALPRRTDARSDIEPASVVFYESSVVWYLNDTQWVRGLLEQGWKSRLPPRAGLGEEEEHASIARTCGFR